MKKIHSLLFLNVLLVINFSLPVFSQDDCLGVSSSMLLFSSGINAGYGFQNFSAEGFNHYIDVYNELRPNLMQKMDKFDSASGFRFGITPLQFSAAHWVMGLKLSYHFLSETHEATASVPDGTARREYNLKMKSLYFTMSFGYNVSEFLTFKVADLSLTFTSVDLKNSLFEPGLPAEEQKLTSVDNPLGVNMSSGLIIYILPQILAIEATVGYSFLYINEMEFEDGGNKLQIDENTSDSMLNFIDGGGLYVFGQINLSIPFQ